MILLDHVYEPSDDTFMLAEAILNENRTFNLALDMGCGSGALSIILAEKASHIIALDINPSAVKNTKLNALINGLSYKIDVICGDLFHPIRYGYLFDLIVFNPPYLPEDEYDQILSLQDRLAWSGGISGRETIDAFINLLNSFMRNNGVLLMIQSSLSDYELTVKRLKNLNFKVKVIAIKNFFFERLCVIRAEKRDFHAQNICNIG